MARADSPAAPIPEPRGALASALAMLWRDKLACAASVFLLLMAFCAVFGPALLGDVGTGMNLKMRNAPPGSIQQGWMFILGADALGRPILPRIIVAAQNTIGVATAAVVVAMVAGGVLGLIAGYSGGWLGTLIMRFADIIMSFPSLLLAVVILYMFEPRVANLVLVLAITRMPVYIRTTRAEVLEIRERMYVNAARVLGASTGAFSRATSRPWWCRR